MKNVLIGLKLVILLMPLLSKVSWAEEALFLENQPIESQSAIIKALEKRQWAVYEQSKETIKANVRSDGRRVSADIFIYYKDNSFYYTATATKTKRISKGVGKFKNVEVATEVPGFWIRNVQNDAQQIIQQDGQ